MEYELKKKIIVGVNKQEPPHKIFEGYVKVNVNTKKSKSKS